MLRNQWTNRRTQRREPLKELHLEEIILFYDGDNAGKEAIKHHCEILHQLRPGLKLSYIETPENEDINSLWTRPRTRNIYQPYRKQETSLNLPRRGDFKKQEPGQSELPLLLWKAGESTPLAN